VEQKEGDNTERWNDRTRRLIGDEAVQRLRQAHVLVAGLGGVGGYAVEMLARSGIGHLTLIDADTVSPSNLNRQLIALRSTIGQFKTTLFAGRIADINPECLVDAADQFLTPGNIADMIPVDVDFVVDAIDTVASKVALIAHCMQHNISLISSMGAGGRMDVTRVQYADLWQTAEDGLARAVRQRLKKMKLRKPLHVVFSSEAPHAASLIELALPGKRSSFGTTASIPAVFGIYLANHVIKSLIYGKG